MKRRLQWCFGALVLLVFVIVKVLWPGSCPPNCPKPHSFGEVDKRGDSFGQSDKKDDSFGEVNKGNDSIGRGAKGDDPFADVLRWRVEAGLAAIAVPNQQPARLSDQAHTHDDWPQFTKRLRPGPIPRSPFHPNYTLKWDFDVQKFLKRPDVKDQPPKLMTWMVKPRYMPLLPEPVRLRMCPEMPCRMTTDFKRYQNTSAVLMWAAQLMTSPVPPPRHHPDQVFLLQNHEPQKSDWIMKPSFRRPAWKSAFNWTMTYSTKPFHPGPIPRSPFNPNYTLKWDFDVQTFLERPDVKDQPPKLMTWMVKPRYMPLLPEPVRLRMCPEMPCRMSTDFKRYQNRSAVLMWAAQLLFSPVPPLRHHPDQVFLLQNHEPQKSDWNMKPSFRRPAWKSAFNWTMTYRLDSDIVGLYGALNRRPSPPHKDYVAVVRAKTGLAVEQVSSCRTMSRREDYVTSLQHHIDVDVFGDCSSKKLHCPRKSDDLCFQRISTKYKFFLAFENGICNDMASEKFFRYFNADLIVVARGAPSYKNHAPSNTFINTADFRSAKELADYLLYLDSHPEEYIRMLKAKDEYEAVYEDWPIRNGPQGEVTFMTYHYQAVAYCQACRRLWELDRYRKSIPDISRWFDKQNCQQPTDLPLPAPPPPAPAPRPPRGAQQRLPRHRRQH